MASGRKRILYGFQGDGRGHLSRTEALVRELAVHHDVLILTTETGLKNLSEELRNLPGVRVAGEVFSPRLYFKNDRIWISRTLLKTAVDVMGKALPGFIRGLRVYLRYRPHLIISDLEPFTAWFAWLTGKRFLSFDHQHVLTNSRVEFPPEFSKDHRNACFMVKFLVPVARLTVITSFFFPRITKHRTHIFRPLLRKEIVAARERVKKGDFTLVYLTSSATLEMLDRVLKQIGSERFVVYNKNRSYQDGNITYKGISIEGFIEDLASCKAVLCNGGYLVSEALFLGKPVLSIPIVNSFDQILNSVYLDRLGYGQFSRKFTPSEIGRFLARVDGFRQNIERNDFCGNRQIVEFVLEYARNSREHRRGGGRPLLSRQR